jgi:hypothetical protein
MFPIVEQRRTGKRGNYEAMMCANTRPERSTYLPSHYTQRQAVPFRSERGYLVPLVASCPFSSQCVHQCDAIYDLSHREKRPQILICSNC